MKKLYGLLIIFAGVLLLSGCGNNTEKNNESNKEKEDVKEKYICTAHLEENDNSAEGSFEATLDDDGKVESVDVIFDFESKEYADQLVTMVNFVNAMTEDESKKIVIKQDGNKVTIKNYEKMSGDEEEVDDDEVSLTNIVGMTKEEFKAALEKMETTSDVVCK